MRIPASAGPQSIVILGLPWQGVRALDRGFVLVEDLFSIYEGRGCLLSARHADEEGEDEQER